MVDVNTQNKTISVNVSSSGVSSNINASGDYSYYYSEKAREWAISNRIVDGVDYSSKYYAGRANQSALNAQSFAQSAQDAITTIDTKSDEAIETINNTVDGVIEDIEAEANEQIANIERTGFYMRDDKLYFINSEGEEEEFKSGGGSGFNLFDTKVSDHILEGDELKGWELQGTWVYKEAVAGVRFGYPSFYEKCLEEYQEATNTETINGVTVKVHSNGHKFYDIANKDAIDNFFNTMGSAWFYGVDTENERIFLPRNNYFEQATADGSEVGQSVEAGLPNITGYFINDSGGYSGAFYSGGQVDDDTNGAGQGNEDTKISFDASRSNPIYGNSDTVQPNAVKKLLYICVGNTVSDTSWVDVVTQVENGVLDLENATNEGLSALSNASNALRQTQITNCILAMPEITYSGNTFTIKAGTKALIPNGFNADGTYNNVEWVAQADVVQDVTLYADGNSLLLHNGNLFHSNFLGSFAEAPELGGSNGTYYNTTENKIYISTGTEWVFAYNFILGELLATDGVITSFKPKEPIRLVDYNEMEEVHCVIETYSNGNSWYRIWSDGWCEQGGIFDSGSEARSIQGLASFLIPFRFNDYLFNFTPYRGSAGNFVGAVGTNNKETTQITMSYYGSGTSDVARFLMWEAKGYI